MWGGVGRNPGNFSRVSLDVVEEAQFGGFGKSALCRLQSEAAGKRGGGRKRFRGGTDSRAGCRHRWWGDGRMTLKDQLDEFASLLLTEALNKIGSVQQARVDRYMHVQQHKHLYLLGLLLRLLIRS